MLSDCITSYDKKKLPELLAYYESKGCAVMTFQEVLRQTEQHKNKEETLWIN